MRDRRETRDEATQVTTGCHCGGVAVSSGGTAWAAADTTPPPTDQPAGDRVDGDHRHAGLEPVDRQLRLAVLLPDRQLLPGGLPAAGTDELDDADPVAEHHTHTYTLRTADLCDVE